MTGQVLVVGSLQVVVHAEVDRVPAVGDAVTATGTRRTVGGRGLDQALAARRAGARVALVASVGDDDAGRWCEDHLASLGVEPRLHVVPGESTATRVVMTAGHERDASLLLHGAAARFDGRAALAAAADGDVVLVQLDVPPPAAADVLREADRRQLRAVVNASPFAVLDPDAAAIADPFVVGERDAALLADVGLMPASLCVTFGRAGAVWDGTRVDSDDLGTPAMPDGGTEAFCGTLAAGLAAGLDRRAALRDAVAASALTDW
ncbi:MAG TPA: PfkB family carbohydrate kinase [Lapillicoccus sp.]|nr:PfkB family carbohydrate kinase [Lapillicoccus sp.]